MRSHNDVPRESSRGGGGAREPGAEKPVREPIVEVAVSPAIESARLPEEELARLAEASASRQAAKVLPDDIAGKGTRR